MIKISLTSPKVALSSLNNSDNNFFSNIALAPDEGKIFSDFKAVKEWLKTAETQPSPENSLYKEDDTSIQGWTYVADYKTHKLSLTQGKTFYIHARITADNKLEFTFFDTIVQSNIVNNLQALALDFTNNNTTKSLKIASKEEAEKYLLTADKSKIKLSALPKYAGYLNDYSEQFIDNRIYNVFGNICSYWYTISNNILYFCGFPLYESEDTGLLFDENKNLVEGNLPPTHLNYDLVEGNTPFKEALDLVAKKDTEPDENGVYSGAKKILQKYGDSTESSEVMIIPVANNFRNITHGDVFNNINAFSETGGAYQHKGEIKIADFYDLTVEMPAREYGSLSGCSVIPTSLIEEVDGTYTLYKNGRYSNSFIVASINNNISISISDSSYYFGEGEEITVDNGGGGGEGGGGEGGGGYWPGPIVIGGGGGGGGINYVVPPGNDDDDDDEPDRPQKSLRINAGDIGNEYIGTTAIGLTSHATYTINTYDANGAVANSYIFDDEDALGVFEYELDVQKVIWEKRSYVNDSEENLLTKKLSRKLDVSISCNPYEWIRVSRVDRYLSMKDVFYDARYMPSMNLDAYKYTSPKGKQPTGPVEMDISLVDVANSKNTIKIKFTTASKSASDMWPNNISFNNEDNSFYIENNELFLFYEGVMEYKPKDIVIEQITPSKTTENKNIQVTNNIFKREWATMNPEPHINSFPVPPSKLGGYNRKVSICYTTRKFKLRPKFEFFVNLYDLFMARAQRGELEYDETQTLPYITCSVTENGIEVEKPLYDIIKNKETLKSTIMLKYLEQPLLKEEDGTFNGWENIGNPNNIQEPSEIPPIEIDLTKITTGSTTPTIPGIEYNMPIDDEAEMCIINTDLRSDLDWFGKPRLKFKGTSQEIVVGNDDKKQSLIISFTQAGDGWTEYHLTEGEKESAANGEQPWETPTHPAYRYELLAPEGYRLNNNEMKINFFGAAGENLTSSEIVEQEMAQEE